MIWFTILAKRISEEQKKEILEDFLNNKTLEEIAKKYNFTKLTIIRNLKKNLGDKKYQELMDVSKPLRPLNTDNAFDQDANESYKSFEVVSQELLPENPFLEIDPLDYEIERRPQKDFSSISILEVDLPKTVYMIVDKNIELRPKLLKEYAEWSFLSEIDLNRKTIEIYLDLKTAKRFCAKDQKVIKVPDSNVFKVTAPKLVSQGITRIVSSQLLIAL